MAKATLPTNFKDDILASSMGSKRRYNVINNSDGTISLEDVTTYTQVGSTFGAAQINATNAAANAAADASKIIDDYDTLMANTQAGYMAGALAVKELNSNLSNYEIIQNNSRSVEIKNHKMVLAIWSNGSPIVEFCDIDNNKWARYSGTAMSSFQDNTGAFTVSNGTLTVNTINVGYPVFVLC